MNWFVQTCRTSLGKKYIMAVTGFLLAGFLLVHAAGNSTIFWGRTVFNSYAEHLHSLGFLVTVAEILLLFIFVLHIYTGLTLFLQNRNSRTSRYQVQRAAGGRTIGSRTMPWTGLIILAFLIIHLLNFHFVPHDRPIADIVTPVLTARLYGLIYLLAMTALGLHISHGLWSLCQSLGINHPRYNKLIRTLAWAGCVLIAGIFLVIVMLLQSSSGFLQ